MASSKEYLEFVKDQLRNLDGITIRPMFGEYVIYLNNLVIGGIYDDRLLVKKTESNKKFDMDECIPYPNAKPMYFVDEIDNIEILEKIILETYQGLMNLKN